VGPWTKRRRRTPRWCAVGGWRVRAAGRGRLRLVKHPSKVPTYLIATSDRVHQCSGKSPQCQRQSVDNAKPASQPSWEISAPSNPANLLGDQMQRVTTDFRREGGHHPDPESLKVLRYPVNDPDPRVVHSPETPTKQAKEAADPTSFSRSELGGQLSRFWFADDDSIETGSSLRIFRLTFACPFDKLKPDARVPLSQSCDSRRSWLAISALV